MRMRMKVFVAIVLAVVTVSSTSYGWWDTQIMAIKEVPKIAEIEAEKATLSGEAMRLKDRPPFGPNAGKGQAVELKPGDGRLTWKIKLSRSVYKLLVIARVPEANPSKNKSPEWPLFARMKVTGPKGTLVGDWSLQINYLNTYYDTARMFFPVHETGKYTIEFSITGESKTNLLVDRLELRDELGNTEKHGFKTGRYLHTDAEVAQIRRSFRDWVLEQAGATDAAALKAVVADKAKFASLVKTVNVAGKWQYNERTADILTALTEGPILPGNERRLDPAKRAERVAAFRKVWGTGYESWNTADRGRWALKGLDQRCLKTGDPVLALRAAQMLIRIADWYPALDWSAQIKRGYGSLLNRSIRFTFTNGRFGKIQYGNWEVGYPDGFAKVYDAIYPFIVENVDELVEMAQVRVPWIKTKADLIAFLDTRLLQYPGDCVDRGVIRCSLGGSENVMLHVIAVQGPNRAGQRLIRRLYTRTYWDATNDGGIQDQAITGRLRDGSSYIGSIGYTEGAGAVLVRAVELVKRYIAAGGSAEFDLSDANRFPSVLAGAFLPLECRVAGGYHPRTGDWGRAKDPRVYDRIGTYADCFRMAFTKTQDPRMAWLLKNVVGRTTEPDPVWAEIEALAADQRDPQLSSVSRNLQGFGLAILEAGSEHDDFTRKRALIFRHGAGKGHAHADSLNLEFFAHGVRAVPDAGNRGGKPHPGDMRAHLGVTVDGAGMRNSGEINVSGTAWTTAFAPMPGAQYVSGAARFAAAPQVRRYERQAVMVDVAGTDDSYVFDVLRVAGGRTHVWSTHGPARGEKEPGLFNFKLKPATSDAAKKALSAHNRPQEGTGGDMIVATWAMGKGFEAGMLGKAFRKDTPPLFTRTTLFGHKGDAVFVGDSDPLAKGLESSQWMCTIGFMHVQGKSAESLETVWPQLIESYRGQPFIRSATALPVMPVGSGASAPVALRVETTTGQTDVLIAHGDGTRQVKTADTTLTGRFGMISRDAKGLRLAHLVGGTRLTEGDLTIAADTAAYKRTIVAVNYLKREITLDQSLPTVMPAGLEFLIGAPAHPQAWMAEAVSGTHLTVRQSPILYQSELLSVDEKTGELMCSMSSNMLLADPHYYDGVTATDETGTHAWRVKTMRPKYIFMYLQEPFQDWRELYSNADFPDTDGDGRRTVVFTNWGGGDGSPAIEKVVMEVAFVDEDRQVIYFKLHKNPEVVSASGWQWAGSRLMGPDKGRWMINEKGRRWIPNYTGKQNVIALEGKVRDDDFTDADKDGRRVLRMYHFGVGDSVEMQTSVYVARNPNGKYDVQASTPCRVDVAGKRVK